jgi:hypothetical protein
MTEPPRPGARRRPHKRQPRRQRRRAAARGARAAGPAHRRAGGGDQGVAAQAGGAGKRPLRRAARRHLHPRAGADRVPCAEDRPAPVLACCRRSALPLLEQVSAGLNTPFRERPGRACDVGSPLARCPLVWARRGLLVLAACVALWPAGGFSWMSGLRRRGFSVGPGQPMPLRPRWWPAARSSAAPASALPAPAGVASEPAATAAATAPVVAGRPPHRRPNRRAHRHAVPRSVAADASWVEVLDARGQTAAVPHRAAGRDRRPRRRAAAAPEDRQRPATATVFRPPRRAPRRSRQARVAGATAWSPSAAMRRCACSR